MNIEDIKLVKITYEYNDGTRKTLEGDEVKKFEDNIGTVCTLAHLHGKNPNWDELKWKVEKSEELKKMEEYPEREEYPYGC